LGLEENWIKEELGLKLAQQEGERISRGSRSFLLKAWYQASLMRLEASSL